MPSADGKNMYNDLEMAVHAYYLYVYSTISNDTVKSNKTTLKEKVLGQLIQRSSLLSPVSRSSYGRIVVKHFPLHLEVKGLNPAVVADDRSETKAGKSFLGYRPRNLHLHQA